ncbi:hypothetical protein SCHPADRAFT_167630 [Schizopora paradoxa]|uniref:Uncharacterized protein n=1 Tax=Schizopora paradoxa TaxID=27342 RepID=A0A0H2S0B9_9AGAM|nr:hypothetical protein SCHPADRAFT_167630 [Schizopora paradoxa]
MHALHVTTHLPLFPLFQAYTSSEDSPSLLPHTHPLSYCQFHEVYLRTHDSTKKSFVDFRPVVIITKLIFPLSQI